MKSAGLPPASNALPRFVKFRVMDRDPLPNYAELLDRVMTNVTDFHCVSPCHSGITSLRSPNATVA